MSNVLNANLDPVQRAAATDPARDILALACAGSGKSTTMAYRIARLLAEGTDPRGIVAFTFTEKAAESIKLRVSRALAASGIEATVIGAMYIGTIHSYCQNVLGEMRAQYRQFEVLDDNRLKLYIISRYRNLDVESVRQNRNARYFEAVSGVAEAWKTVNDELLSLADVETADPILGSVLRRLQQGLFQDQFIDFSMMIRLVVDALAADDPAAIRAIDGVRHLMVDEYQDVNPAQEALIRQLRRFVSTLFVVGDDDQAIYAWRGADVSNILQFNGRYSGCSVHTLSNNYRSTPAIVSVADGFVSAELGPLRIAKNPSAPNNPQPRDIRNLWFDDRGDEVRWVVGRIQSLLGTEYVERDGSVRGLTPGDFAILMRSTRNTRYDPEPKHAPFTRALLGARIPYTVEAGGGVFDRLQVQVMRSTFELLRSQTPDRIAVRSHFDNIVLAAFPNADFDALASVLAQWGRRIHRPPGGTRQRLFPQALVHDLLEAFRIADTQFDDGVLADLGVFSRIMQDVETVYLSIDSNYRFSEVLNFLSNVAETGYDSGSTDILRRPDSVTVSTVHRVKGLEFPVVFIVDMEAQRFPRNRSRYSGWVPNSLMAGAISRGAYQGTPEEEARLFYTAMTRAERYLYVTGSKAVPGSTGDRRRSAYALRVTGNEVSTDQTALPAGLQPAAPRRRVDENVVPTSFSEIRYYLRCPHDYRMRKLFGFSPPIVEMFGFGQTVHTAVTTLHERFPSSAPTRQQAEDVAEDIFHLKHIPPSRDPVNNPGGYERAQQSSKRIVGNYAAAYDEEFTRSRQLEARFEIPIQQAVISGSIDLLLREDVSGNIVGATVIDFKAMEGGPDAQEQEDLRWTELSLQVQLYAKAANEVIGEPARTGKVHLLKDNQRIEIPVDDAAVNDAVANVEWAVERILAGDYPRRPSVKKCNQCDFAKLCSKRPDQFTTTTQPPPIHVPGGSGRELALAFSDFDP